MFYEFSKKKITFYDSYVRGPGPGRFKTVQDGV